MLQDMLKLLDKRHPGAIEVLAHDNFAPGSAKQNHPYISETPEKIRSVFEMKPGVFVETNLSSSAIVRFLDAVFDKMGEDKNLFSFSIIAENSDDDAEE